MITVLRDQVDDQGVPIRPDAAWEDLAVPRRAQALNQAGLHAADGGVYGHASVRMALERLFHDKCAYCETKVSAGFPIDVDHYRPKGRVAERADHDGYYWLTYTWTNLFPSCAFCNQRRQDKPRWGDTSLGVSAGKLDQFPLADEQTRCMGPAGDLDAEDRLLLDPCTDHAEEHLAFSQSGKALPRNGSPKGRASIGVFNLNRRRLRDARLERIALARSLIAEFAPLATRDEARRRVLDRLSAADQAYAATVRAMQRDPAAFAI